MSLQYHTGHRRIFGSVIGEWTPLQRLNLYMWVATMSPKEIVHAQEWPNNKYASTEQLKCLNYKCSQSRLEILHKFYSFANCVPSGLWNHKRCFLDLFTCSDAFQNRCLQTPFSTALFWAKKANLDLSFTVLFMHSLVTQHFEGLGTKKWCNLMSPGSDFWI